MTRGRVDERKQARRRLRGFGLHLLGYFVVMAGLVAVNLANAPENPWFVWPMVGWGGILAFHAAFTENQNDRVVLAFGARDCGPPPLRREPAWRLNAAKSQRL